MAMDLQSIDSLVYDVPTRPILFASMPSYQTWIKCAILLEALNVPYDLVVLEGAKDLYTDWYKKIHPQQYVPALVDEVDGERFELWDSTSIIMYICDRYDLQGAWWPRSWSKSRADVVNWSFFHACSLFPIAKIWLQLNTRHEAQRNLEMEKTMHHELKVRFDLLNERLSQPEQRWLAVPNRPTIADLINYPFVDEKTSDRLDLPLKDWPALEEWSKRMKELQPVSTMYGRLETIEPTGQI